MLAHAGPCWPLSEVVGVAIDSHRVSRRFSQAVDQHRALRTQSGKSGDYWDSAVEARRKSWRLDGSYE